MSAILKGVDPFTQPSFTLKNRMQRVGWGVIYSLLFRPSPRPFHAWRAFLLRLCGAKLGKQCHVYATARIWAPWNLVLDDHAIIGDHVICYSMAVISVGKRAVISQGTHLCTGTHDYEDPNFQLYTEPIHIGDNVWVAADCFIGPGVSIGEGAVIGARSVVTKPMPPWMVCVGHPCKPIKPRVMRQA